MLRLPFQIETHDATKNQLTNEFQTVHDVVRTMTPHLDWLCLPTEGTNFRILSQTSFFYALFMYKHNGCICIKNNFMIFFFSVLEPVSIDIVFS